MWDLSVSVPDNCLSFYFVAFVPINLQISKYFVKSCYCNSLFLA